MTLPKELSELLEAGVHFGHQAKRWNPKMKKFIFGKRSGIYIIDLEKTLEKIKEAQEFLRGVARDGKDILYVGTKKQAQGVIKEIASTFNMPFIVDRWVGGLLTNFEMVKSRIEHYKQLLQQRDEGSFDKLPKKEVVRMNKELGRMDTNFSGVKDMEKMPGALFVVDPKKEILAVREAQKVGIPIVALIDTDSDPEVIDYPIPGNDDALKSIKVILSFIMDAVGKDLIKERKTHEAVKEEEPSKSAQEAQALPDTKETPKEKKHASRRKRSREGEIEK